MVQRESVPKCQRSQNGRCSTWKIRVASEITGILAMRHPDSQESCVFYPRSFNKLKLTVDLMVHSVMCNAEEATYSTIATAYPASSNASPAISFRPVVSPTTSFRQTMSPGPSFRHTLSPGPSFRQTMSPGPSFRHTMSAGTSCRQAVPETYQFPGLILSQKCCIFSSTVCSLWRLGTSAECEALSGIPLLDLGVVPLHAHLRDSHPFCKCSA